MFDPTLTTDPDQPRPLKHTNPGRGAHHAWTWASTGSRVSPRPTALFEEFPDPRPAADPAGTAPRHLPPTRRLPVHPTSGREKR